MFYRLLDELLQVGTHADAGSYDEEELVQLEKRAHALVKMISAVAGIPIVTEGDGLPFLDPSELALLEQHRIKKLN
jgi:hypothetical protein